MTESKIKSANSGRKPQHGFTLVEVLISVVLFSTLVIIVSSMFSFINRTFRRVDGNIASASEIERILLRLDGELRSATEVTAPPSDAMGNTLRFYNKDGYEIGYTFSEDGKLTRTDYWTKSSRVLLNGVTDLSFGRFSRGLVNIVISSGKVSVMTAIHVWNLP